MSLIRVSLGISFCLLGVACSTSSAQLSDAVLGADTKEVFGEFSGRGEWAIFPGGNVRGYNPYSVSENQKCISVVNSTNKPREVFAKFNEKFVSISGYTVEYDKLSDGVTKSDILLSKKYLNGEVVENSCLRKFIFVAKNITKK